MKCIIIYNVNRVIVFLRRKEEMIELPFDEDIDIRMLENVFDDMTNSYKIFWFLGVFEEVIANKKIISFIKTNFASPPPRRTPIINVTPKL